MKTYIIFAILFIGIINTSSNAQTTAIPDINFEQELINRGIDSDGTLNGQVLTSDIAGVLHLNLQYVHDLTGLQDFTALESLKLDEGGGNLYDNITVDLTANINLKKVEIWTFGGLSKLALTGLTDLEELILWEGQDDVITMEIDTLDLSTNTNIKKVDLGAMHFMFNINLQNGNNANMLNFVISLAQGQSLPARSMCIKVDNATAATANATPYDSWMIYGIVPTFYDTGVCTLSAKDVEMVEVALYPNPVQNEFRLKSPVPIKGIKIFSMQGKQVARFSSQEGYDVSSLQPGIYFLKIHSDRGTSVEKFVKE